MPEREKLFVGVEVPLERRRKPVSPEMKKNLYVLIAVMAVAIAAGAACVMANPDTTTSAPAR